MAHLPTRIARTLFATAFAAAACGGTDALNVVPGDPGTGGGSGAASTSGSGGFTVTGPTDTVSVSASSAVSTGATSTTVGSTVGSTSSVSGAGGAITATVGAGGSGGTGGDGMGGDGGNSPGCIPGRSIGCTCVSGEPGAQVCEPEGIYGECKCTGGGTWEQQQLARLRRGIVGTWAGKQTNPWDAGCSTTITFAANGVYSAHSPGDECPVFYYGSNQDSAEKTYLLNDVLPTSEGQGEIAFWFGPGNTNRGVIRHLVLSADENRLDFQAWKGEYGPLVFTLKRVSRAP